MRNKPRFAARVGAVALINGQIVTRYVAQMLALGLALNGMSSPGYAADTKTGDLAKAAQNPIASMISLPFQNDTYFGIGPDNTTANALLIQPVYPISLSEDWNLIGRAIVPLIYVEGFSETDPQVPNAQFNVDSNFGLGDINLTPYFSPKKLLDLGGGKFTWGVGPSLTLNSSTSAEIGSEKWSAGPAAVGVFMNTTSPNRTLATIGRCGSSLPSCSRSRW